MVDARPRRESPEDVSPGAKYEQNTVTPLRVAHKDDLMHTTSRRLSQMIMNHLNPVATPEPILRKSYFTRVHQPQDPSTLTTPASVPLSNADNKENSQPISGGLSSVQDGTTMKHDQASLNSDQGSQNPESFNTVSAFRVLCDLEMVRLKVLCEDWNAVLGEEGSSLPKIAADSIRATVGKCQLILKNKLPFFQSLVEMAERSSDATSQGVPRTGVNDLAGYWTLVADEIALVDAAFDRLRKWRDRWNWDASQCPTTPPRSLVVAVQRSKRTASSIPKRLATPQQTKKSTRNTPGRKITVDKLSSEVKEAIVQSVQKSAQKRKPQANSKFSDFLKARKAAISSNHSSAGAAITIFAPPTEERGPKMSDRANICLPSAHKGRPTPATPGQNHRGTSSTLSASPGGTVAEATRSRTRSGQDKRRISFAPKLAHTPGGHLFGSGSPKESYPITPANVSGSIVAVARVRRRHNNLLETLSPLGLRPVSRSAKCTPRSN
ncbi:guanylate kinase-associated protein mars [Clonorchis sinensis]|uniref:Guanylate kinase-associated protein mars n=1 Tax=Clonorchis sinensis TaxID=79923 RepID=G7YKY8_CLOSI|nr:guanylate kinase-associated protein mars [Clonorchis sinensis]